MSNWTIENDEEGWQGRFGQSLTQFENWLIRDEDTDNRDVVAIVPKTGDEQYDDLVTFQNAILIAAAHRLHDGCIAALNWLMEYHTQMGDPADEGVAGLLSQLNEAIKSSTR